MEDKNYVLEVQMKKNEESSESNSFQIVFKEAETEKEKQTGILGFLNKNSQAILTALATITVAIFGLHTSCQQISQKSEELESAKVKSLGELVSKLASKDALERKYATFAAIGLGVKDFDKYIISSLNSPEDIETLEILATRFEDEETKKELKKRISRLYAIRAEQAKENIQESKQFVRLAFQYFPINAQASYRLGRNLQSEGQFANAINSFDDAIKNQKDKENVYAEPNLEISANERKAECLLSVWEKERQDWQCNSANTSYQEAERLLNLYPTKDKDDYDRISNIREKLTALKELCSKK